VGARTTFRAAIAIVATLVSVLAVPVAGAGTTTLSLSASNRTVTYGDAVTLSGAATGDAACIGARAVELRWRGRGAPSFAVVATATTAADGSFAFEATEPSTGRYRASISATGGCGSVLAPDVLVRVRALVETSAVGGRGEAGSCLDLAASVSPPKPGQTIDLQVLRNGRWRTTSTLPLNGDGVAWGRACLGWDDVGTLRYRARWRAQDVANLPGTSRTLAVRVVEARWMRRVERVIGGRPISVSVGQDGTFLFRHLDGVARTPASNEKLLLAMTLLDTFGPDHRIETTAAARTVEAGVIPGDLWLLGRGDPIVTRAALAPLAQELVDAGIRRVAGRVMGSTNYFSRDWDAPGWNDVATDYVNRPTALTFEGNHDRDPERAAAAAFTKLLERRGISVRRAAGAGVPSAGLDPIASMASKPLATLLARMLRPSWNFAAEVLGKGLGAHVRGRPGTIAKGAAAIQAWVRAHGARGFSLHDNSGLSYANRVTAQGIVRLLWNAEDADWGDALRRALPAGGQGTLRDRLHRVKLRAKTGTLTDISALSGWVWADRLGAWVEFSILSHVAKPAASGLEDKIVRLISNNAG
jgi:D-alanyl-D-alanine carboxypeptidase/D-alanyl-D-alanine-endopeptidase (penicillin-binding protein 4)